MKKITNYLSVFLLSVLLTGKINAQLSGAYTIPGSYASIAAVITDLNIYGITGPVTINISAGYTETAPVGGYTLNAIVGASSVNQVTFQKSGAGTNPLITAYAGGLGVPTSTVQDGIWRFAGTDWVTINGIDLSDPNTTNPSTMEFGYGFFKANALDGCQNNTIKNCVITLNRVNNAAGAGPAIDGSRGIDMVSAAVSNHTVVLTITGASGANSNNKFYSNTIQNCNYGISLIGFAAATPFTNADTGNDIGGTSSATGNTIINFGGGGTTSAAAGIRTLAQYGINVAYNSINNNNGAGVNHAQVLRGIYLNTAASTNVTVNSNTVTLNGGGTTQQVTPIENASGSTAANNLISITNNLITNCTYATATSGVFYGIYNNGTTPASLTISGNILSNNATNATSGSYFNIYNSGAVTSVITINNNIVGLGTFNATSTSLELSGIYNTGGAATATLSILSNTLQNCNYLGTTGGTGLNEMIYNSGTRAVINFIGNIFNNILLKTTGTIYLIYDNTSTPITNTNNNSITTGFANTGAGGGALYGYYNFGSPGSGTASFAGNNFSNISMVGAGVFYGLFQATSTSQIEIFTNNIISNVSNIAAATSSVFGLYHSYGAATSAITGNTVTNLVGASVIGIITGSTSASGGLTVSGNVVASCTAVATSGTVSGIYHISGTATNIFKNKVYDLTTSGATGAVAGISIGGGGTLNIYNNLVGDLKAPGTGGICISGLYLAGGTTINAYYNTINLSGTSSGANFGSVVVYAATAPALTLRNNIFVNNCVPTGAGGIFAYYRSSTTLGSYSASSNNNLFYAGTPGAGNLIFYDGTNAVPTLSAFKTLMATRDALSVTENPTYVSSIGTNANFLNINTVTPTQIESGAAAVVGITDDYIGTIRGTFPDIGAWEGTYVPNGTDVAPPTLLASGFTSGACSTSARTFTANLADVSGLGTGLLAPRVYYKVNAGAYTSVAGTLASGTASIGVWSFNMTYAAVVSDVIFYYLVAQDAAGTPNLMASPATGFVGSDVNTITTPPTTLNSFAISNALNGVYTVGALGNYTSLTAAALAYNNSCLTGPVTFSLIDALYSTSETFPIVFLNNLTASASNSLLIRPATALSPTITGSNAVALIRLTGARYITIDGSNASTSSRDLYINNTNTGTSSSNIWIGSASPTGGATNNTVKNCHISGNASNTTGAGIMSSSGTTFGGVAEAANSNNSYINNDVNTSVYGIVVVGPSGNEVNNLISGNDVGSATLANNIGVQSIAIYQQQNALVTKNNIFGINSVNTTPAAAGIYLGGTQSGNSVTLNKITDVKKASAWGASGISLAASTLSSNILVANNFISAINSGGYASGVGIDDNGYGIVVSGGGGYNIYHNSINLNVDQTTGTSAGINITTGVTAAGAINLVNNIFSNVQTVFTRYAVYCEAASSVFGTMNYNNYYSAGPNIGIIAATTRANIAAMQTGFGGNANSINVLPAFTSASDLHLTPASVSNLPLDNAGTPLGSVSIDFDNQVRSLTTPDIGADEFTSTAVCATANGGTLSTAAYTLCSNQNQALVPTGVSLGIGSTYQWKVSSTPGGPYTAVSSGTGGVTKSYITNTLTAGVYYYILTATCSAGPSVNSSNEASVTVNALPNPVIVSSPSVICASGSATLTASGATTYLWNTGATTASIVVTPTASGIYNVTGSTPSCANAVSNNFNLFFSSNPTVTAVSATSVVCAGIPATLTASGANTYSWSNGSTAAVINPTSAIAATYTVTGYKTNGCNSTVSQSIAVNPLPNINISGSSGICTGQTASLTASGASTYSWNTGALTNSITATPVSNTTYTVMGTDALGCSTTTTQLVTVAASLSISITGPSTVCAGKTATLTGTGGVTYLWNGGATTSTLAVTPTGNTTYSIIGSSGTCSNTAQVTVSVNTNPTVGVTGNATICVGATTTLTANGAATYSWNTTATATSIAVSPIVNTTYTVTGFSTAGCSAFTTIAVVSNSVPVITIAQTATGVCLTSAATFTASGASTYTWTGGPINASYTVTPTVTTVYTVTGTNPAGCTSTKTVGLTSYTLPVLAIVPASATVCSLSQANFVASGANTYTWSGTSTPGASVSYTPVSAIVYTVTGTSTQSCVSSGTVGVTTNSLPIIAITPPSATVCSQSVAGFTASGASTYSWNNGPSTASFAAFPVNNSTYSVTGSSSQGCKTSATVGVVALALPTVVISPAISTVCINSTAIYTVSGALTYTWSSNSSNGTTIAITPTALTAYAASGTDINGCISGASAVIITNPLPTLAVSPASATVCPNASSSFTASGAITYSWSTGITTASAVITPSVSSIYTVTGIDGNGCAGTQTLALTTKTVPVISISPASSSVCLNTVASFSANGAVSYTWSNNTAGSGISVSPSITTVYTVTGKNAIGCTSTSTVGLNIWQPPVINIGTNATTVCAKELLTLTASGAATYTWFPFNASGATFTTNPSNTLAYSVIGTDVNGCTNSDTLTVYVNKCTGIKNNTGPDTRISVYPNPSTGLITASFGFEGSKEILVLNSVGALVMKAFTEELSTTIDLSGYAKGVYFIRVQTNGDASNYKIVIQ